MKNESAREVALLVHTANDWTRSVLRGVVSYARDDRKWNLFLEPRGFHESLALPPNWHGDGVILRLTHDGLRESIERQGLPAVNVSWLGVNNQGIPNVLSDERACGTLAVNHLREKGYTRIGYVGPDPGLGYNDTIDQACQSAAACTGSSDFSNSSAYLSLFPEGPKPSRIASIKQWLRRFHRPVGAVAWNSSTSQDLLDACEQLGLHVPEDIGIVCIEHDHLMASIAGTPFTSIDQNPMRVGFEAAKLLDALMHGHDPPDQPVLVQPLGVICRQSTDRAASDDVIVASAMRYIQEHFHLPIQVLDVCKELDVSRRQLEHRFRSTVNSSPACEIRRARLENVKRLLVETELTLEKVASLSGFEHVEVMMRAFKREFGETAGEFRRLR